MSFDAAAAVALCLAEPRLGGAILRGDDGAALLAAIATAVGDRPLIRVPIAVEAMALDDGIDVAASLGAGRPVQRSGLIARAAGGVLVVTMPSRLDPAAVAALARAAEAGTPVVVLAAPDEEVSAALAERLAIDLAEPIDCQGDTVAVADPVATIAAAAVALGVGSMRAAANALCVARGLADGTAIAEADVALAIAAVLLPRATQLPAPPPPAEAQPDSPPPTGGNADAERLVAAAAAILPTDLLARLAGRIAAGKAGRGRDAARGRGAGGRPLAARAGVPRGDARLALIETLTAAAPWQRWRGRTEGARVELRRDDLRVRRRKPKAGPTTVFAVDASGSAAAARLAEAKGAVELMLARAHVARAEVALVAFRGKGAELLLPPTRSLTRARRLLADLPGGGGTPLAAGLEAARQVALAARARGRQAQLVVLTDGRANIGEGDPVAASEAAARAIAVDELPAVLIDIAPRSRPEGARIAAAMRARYLALPRADSAALDAALAP